MPINLPLESAEEVPLLVSDWKIKVYEARKDQFLKGPSYKGRTWTTNFKLKQWLRKLSGSHVFEVHRAHYLSRTKQMI